MLCPKGWLQSFLTVLWQDKWETLRIIARNTKRMLYRALIKGY